MGRTVGYLVNDGHQHAIPEHKSKRFPNPLTAAAHSLADALEHIADQSIDGRLTIWTPYEALQVVWNNGPTTRVPQIHRALAKLYRNADLSDVESAVRIAKRRGSVAHRIVARWARLSIAQRVKSEIEPITADEGPVPPVPQ